MSEADELRVVDEEAVRWITLCRPQSKNGLTVEINQRIIAAVEAAAKLPAIRCLVLSGDGGSFCSGLDLKAAMQRGGLDSIDEDLRRYFHGMILAIRRIEKPVVALLDGAAVGFGCDLALACDLRIGTERTRFGEIFVKRGLMPDGGGTFSLQRVVGVGRALDLLLTGDILEADATLQLGLVTRQFPSATAVDETWKLAKRIGAGPPLSHARIKRAVYGAQSSSLEAALDVERKGQVELLISKDFLEGVNAFLQKREPQFRGE